MAKDIQLTIDHNVTIENVDRPNAAGTAIPLPNDNPGETALDQMRNKIPGTGRAISAQFMIHAGQRLLSATGNAELAQTVETGSRIAFLGARAAMMDPTAMVSLALMAATKALADAREAAQRSNDLDVVRMRAGMMNMDGISQRTRAIDGRYLYSRE